jgi:hypothetical protein
MPESERDKSRGSWCNYFALELELEKLVGAEELQFEARFNTNLT